LNAADPVFECASVALQVIPIVPRPNVEPDRGEHVTGSELPSTRSLALAEKLTGAPLCPVAGVDMSEGTVTVGGVVSTTVTLNELLPLYPESRFWPVAVQVTSVVPRGNVDADAGTQLIV
jgi:hypothetical protein